MRFEFCATIGYSSLGNVDSVDVFVFVLFFVDVVAHVGSVTAVTLITGAEDVGHPVHDRAPGDPHAAALVVLQMMNG